MSIGEETTFTAILRITSTTRSPNAPTFHDIVTDVSVEAPTVEITAQRLRTYLETLKKLTETYNAKNALDRSL